MLLGLGFLTMAAGLDDKRCNSAHSDCPREKLGRRSIFKMTHYPPQQQSLPQQGRSLSDYFMIPIKHAVATFVMISRAFCLATAVTQRISI
jgi:hypothetical protein